MNPNLSTTLPAPLINLTPAPPTKWQREALAFQRLLPTLLETYRGRYVAIHDGQVVASGEDKLAVALEAYRLVGNVAIHVGLGAEGGEPVLRSGVRRVVPPAGGAS